jgi:RNA 2',3'-cyclic 3'-phosphodiesterase
MGIDRVTPKMKLRCFVAIDISEPTRREISEFLAVLQKLDGDIKWVRPSNLHFTIKFLGATPEELLPRIHESLMEIASLFEPFYINIYGTGVFPSRRHPRVIWAGLKNSDMMMRLRHAAEDRISALGFKKEEREFNPHLTLGRVRSAKGIIHILNELDAVREKDFGSTHVRAIRMMKSNLKPDGPEYTCLYELPLGVRIPS